MYSKRVVMRYHVIKCRLFTCNITRYRVICHKYVDIVVVVVNVDVMTAQLLDNPLSVLQWRCFHLLL